MDKLRQWSLATALVAVAVLAAGWFLFVSPQHSKASDLKTQAQAAQDANDTLRAKVAMLKAQAKDQPKEQAKLAALAEKLPATPELPALIRDLTAAAKAAGIDLASVQPGAPAALTAPGGSTSSATSSTAAAAGLQQIPLTLTVNGSYATIKQYLDNLEGLDRALLVTGLTLAPATAASTGGAPGATVPAGTTSLTGTLNAAVFISPSAAAPTPAVSNPAAGTASR